MMMRDERRKNRNSFLFRFCTHIPLHSCLSSISSRSVTVSNLQYSFRMSDSPPPSYSPPRPPPPYESQNSENIHRENTIKVGVDLWSLELIFDLSQVSPVPFTPLATPEFHHPSVAVPTTSVREIVWVEKRLSPFHSFFSIRRKRGNCSVFRNSFEWRGRQQTLLILSFPYFVCWNETTDGWKIMQVIKRREREREEGRAYPSWDDGRKTIWWKEELQGKRGTV